MLNIYFNNLTLAQISKNTLTTRGFRRPKYNTNTSTVLVLYGCCLIFCVVRIIVVYNQSTPSVIINLVLAFVR